MTIKLCAHFIVLISVSFLISGCGASSSMGDPTASLIGRESIESCPAQNRPGSYCYFETEVQNGRMVCTTKRHLFGDLASYCSALKNDGANDQCAKVAREKKFNEECRSLIPEQTSSPSPTAY